MVGPDGKSLLLGSTGGQQRVMGKQSWTWLLLAPATGFVWSACLIIYARLLGRGAWVMSQIGVNVKKRRKKRRKKPTPGPDDRGADNGGAGHARNDER